MLRPEFVVLNSKAASAEEVIKQLSDLFLANDTVKESYYEAVVEREKQYPTGLPSKEVFIAIPHTDSSHVKESSIAIATLEHPVTFGLMGDAEKKLDVGLVMLLAIADPQKQLDLLKDIMGVLSNGSLLKSIKEASTADQVVALLQTSIG
ncbi:PTS sugar transporter subunit IIA [Brevibacillus massiliensis]|jgi:PTS system galactitol-specific IIA component|uniref:PTS sugar transporter subunit IIA n=1 Tax=Brevibacillus massiliensis TaxID=1118054 RepID=UPI0002E37BEE|nr:PTS sugar transporter subunit IIA [Brevibacillus massiliensis]